MGCFVQRGRAGSVCLGPTGMILAGGPPMWQRRLLAICVCVIASGCAAVQHGPQRPCIDVRSLRGPVEAVEAVNHLDQYRSFPIMNLPPDQDHATKYFLEGGDLVLWFSGDPPVVHRAEFLPSDKAAGQ